MVRKAERGDWQDIVSMVRRFVSEISHYRNLLPGDDLGLECTIDQLFRSDDAEIFIGEHDHAPHGLIAMTLYRHPFTGQRMAMELVWWVNPEARGSRLGDGLLEAAELWAVSKGATAMQMVGWNSHLGQYYRRRGYSEAETTYSKALG